MTPDERHALRVAIDAAKRSLVSLCGCCNEPMAPHPNGQTKRFCSKNCRVRAWYRDTERGQVAARAKKRRVYARGGGIAAQRARQKAETS